MAVVVKDKKAIFLRVRDPNKYTDVFDKVGIKYKVDGHNLAVKHNVDTFRILENLGAKLERFEPMRSYYTYPKLHGMFNPMSHQEETAVFVSQNPKAFVLNTQRTGKTASCLWAADYLMKEGLIDKVLVCCTVSNCATWYDEVKAIFANRSVAIARGSRSIRMSVLRQKFDFHIINHDGIKVVSDIWDNYITDRTLLIIDEARLFSDPKSDRWKVMNEIASKVKYAWALTGTPLSGGPVASYGFIKLITPHNVPKTVGAWQVETMFKIADRKWVPKRGWENTVYKALQPAIRFNADDVLDLPPLQMMYVEAELTADQAKAYNKLRHDGAIPLKEGKITAANAGVLVFKLLQTAAGVVKLDNSQDDDSAVLKLPPKGRLKVLDEIIQGTENKVIVFASYKAVVDLLQEHCNKKYGSVWIDGRVTGKKRDEAVRKFQSDPDVKVLVAHPKTTSHGLEFAVADTIVWFTPHHSLELYDQANKRIQSKLQKNNMGIYHIFATSLERAIYTKLANGSEAQASFLELYKQEITGKQGEEVAEEDALSTAINIFSKSS